MEWTNEMCEDEGVRELNLQGVNVKTPEICPWKSKEELEILTCNKIIA